MTWLLVFVPLAIALEYLAAALAILPLAAWMGCATEQLAERSGEGVSGLLNATLFTGSYVAEHGDARPYSRYT